MNDTRKRKYSPRPSRQKWTISKDALQELVWQMPCTDIAKRFGVSDNAVNKKCKLLSISKPPRGYWQKKLQGKSIKKK